MMWKAAWCGLQELTGPTGKIHQQQLCSVLVLKFCHLSTNTARAPHVFQIHWYMTQIFPFLFVSEMLSTVWKISKSKEFSANLKTMPQVGKHLRQEWAAKHQLLDSFEYFFLIFIYARAVKRVYLFAVCPMNLQSPPVPQLWFISEWIHERQIACFQIHTLVWYCWALHHLEEIFSHLSQSSLSPHTCKTIAPVCWPLRDHKSFQVEERLSPSFVPAAFCLSCSCCSNICHILHSSAIKLSGLSEVLLIQSAPSVIPVKGIRRWQIQLCAL